VGQAEEYTTVSEVDISVQFHVQAPGGTRCDVDCDAEQCINSTDATYGPFRSSQYSKHFVLAVYLVRT
jgi:hypothetical protein